MGWAGFKDLGVRMEGRILELDDGVLVFKGGRGSGIGGGLRGKRSRGGAFPLHAAISTRDPLLLRTYPLFCAQDSGPRERLFFALNFLICHIWRGSCRYLYYNKSQRQGFKG